MGECGCNCFRVSVGVARSVGRSEMCFMIWLFPAGYSTYILKSGLISWKTSIFGYGWFSGTCDHLQSARKARMEGGGVNIQYSRMQIQASRG